MSAKQMLNSGNHQQHFRRLYATSLFTTNNFAGPTQVEARGKPTKREPWAHALSGKNLVGE
eukprot:7935727-Pyramimonas_sp.AAC.1